MSSAKVGGHHAGLYVATGSPIHRLAPEPKVVAALAFVVAVALTPPAAVIALVIDLGAVGAGLVVSRLGLRRVVARFAVATPFLGLAALVPLVAGGERIDVLGVALSQPGLWAAWGIASRVVLGVATSVLLAGTTELPVLLAAMARLRVPAAFVTIAGFMVRYLDVIAAEWHRTRVAMTARCYQPRWLWEARPVASSAGTMFVRSYERGERVHQAMLARGFTGRMPQLDDRRATWLEWTGALALPAVAVAGALGARLL